MKKKEEGQGEKDDEAMEAEIEDEVDYSNKAPQDIPLDLSLKPVQQVICTPDILPKQPVPLRPTPVRLLTPVVYKKTLYNRLLYLWVFIKIRLRHQMRRDIEACSNLIRAFLIKCSI